jgi:ubiquitin-conjugating enzyme E2 D|uniref:UBC core domain-containing protein n=1 Tax=Haptolina brevifila TaxID=156173 RepID=A0A7S2IWD0_9EUKA|mmetsp:Transcript_72709/g.144442  ORF Transcript_72709/g.144442 Transcript_72709/m.144442 type:complete len:327 (+) Transcript_72709:538-1518(+)
MAHKRLGKELEELQNNPRKNIMLPVQAADLFHWTVSVTGPKESPYEGGTFLLDINFPSDYPFQFPTLKFQTTIFHPNIGEDGVVVFWALQSGEWSPSWRITKLLDDVLEMVASPQKIERWNSMFKKPNQDAMRRVKEDRYAFENIARAYTVQYAGGVAIEKDAVEAGQRGKRRALELADAPPEKAVKPEPFDKMDYESLCKHYFEPVVAHKELAMGMHLRKSAAKARIECATPGFKELRKKISQLKRIGDHAAIYSMLRQLRDWEIRPPALGGMLPTFLRGTDGPEVIEVVDLIPENEVFDVDSFILEYLIPDATIKKDHGEAGPP